KEGQRPGSLIDLENYLVPFDDECSGYSSSLESITTCIVDFEGSVSDSMYRVIKSRLAHVYDRVKRLKLPVDNVDEAVTFKNESLATTLKLESDLSDKASSSHGEASSNVEQIAPIINVPVPVVTYISKSAPLSEWPVKFKGDGRDVFTFLERVTELALSRKVSEQDLFDSAVELFSGDAVVWYRSIRSSVTDWQSLVARLKPPAETTKVNIIRKNLLPEYITQLALVEDLVTVSRLSVLARRIEEARKVSHPNSDRYSRQRHHFKPKPQEETPVEAVTSQPSTSDVNLSPSTDHYSLLWLNSIKNPTGRLARWAVRLRQYTFDLVHRKGSHNIVPDSLSRAAQPHSSESDSDIEVVSLEVNPDQIDPWYGNLMDKVSSSPDSYPQWKIENDLLLKFVPNNLPVASNVVEWKYLVPKPQRKDIIESCHSPPTCGHFGFSKTMNRFKNVFIGLRCIIALDLMGPFPRSKQGYQWLLVVGDWFSKYTLLFPLRSSKSHHILKLLENEVFLVYGVPQFIICDNGPQFISTKFRELCGRYEIQKILYNAVYSPNGFMVYYSML
ncbi:unnamed protein product, partial [Callosobruchus maculatus]